MGGTSEDYAFYRQLVLQVGHPGRASHGAIALCITRVPLARICQGFSIWMIAASAHKTGCRRHKAQANPKHSPIPLPLLLLFQNPNRWRL
jgi:hypothetical protein